MHHSRMTDRRSKRKNATSLEKSYYDPKSEGGFGGIQSLSKKAKFNKKDTLEWLLSQETYTLHKQRRKTFPRRRVLAAGLGHQWQTDLIDVTMLSRANDRVRYLMTCIDVFSKKAWVVPLKDKKGDSIVQAFESIQDRLPFAVQSNEGKEYVNRHFQKWLRDNNVHFFFTRNREIKAGIVERFNRTLKSKLWRYMTYTGGNRYIDVLPRCTKQQAWHRQK